MLAILRSVGTHELVKHFDLNSRKLYFEAINASNFFLYCLEILLYISAKRFPLLNCMSHEDL